MNTVSISRFVYIAITSAALVAGCNASNNADGPPDGGAPTAARAAVDAFWRTYHNNDYAHIAEVQAALQAAIDLNPNNAELHALLGATHWWHVGEASRDLHPDPSVLSTDLPTAVQLLERAAQLDPNEDHYSGFIGATTVHVGQL